jgi:hypothetical protein
MRAVERIDADVFQRLAFAVTPLSRVKAIATNPHTLSEPQI